MSTKLIAIKATDYYDNPKELTATSFYGGHNRGIMLSLVISHLSGNKARMEIELKKEDAINLANLILEKFKSE